MSQKSSSRLTYIKSISLEIDYLEFVAEKGDNSLGKAGCWLASLERLSSQIKLNCQLFIFLALHTWGRGFWLKHDALTQITNNARSHMSLINWWVILLSYLTASRHTEMRTFSYLSYNNIRKTTLKYSHKFFIFVWDREDEVRSREYWRLFLQLRLFGFAWVAKKRYLPMHNSKMRLLRS